MKTKEICTGIKLCTHNTKQFKTSVVTLSLITQLDNKASDKALVINLLARTNMNYPTLNEFNRKLASLYGAVIQPKVNKIGEAQVLSLTLSFIDNKFALKGEDISEQAINLLLDCLFRPDITPKGFKSENLIREKRLLKEKIDSENDDKIAFAQKRLIEEMCEFEAYGINRFGTKEDIDKADEKSLFELWKNLLMTSAIQINVTGNFQEDKIEKLIKERFDVLQRKSDSIIYPHTEFLTQSYGEKTVTDKQSIKQSKLTLGFRAGMTYDFDNYAAIMLMNSVFGSGTFSKLFTNVREKMSLCYYCSSRLIRNKGIITVQSGVETENIQKTIDAIKAEFEKMKNGDFTEEDVNRAKLSIKDSLLSSTDSAFAIDSWFLSHCVSGEFYTPEEYIEMIENVSIPEIVVAANMVSLDTVYILEGEKEEQ